MTVERLERRQIISASLAETWAFFSRPENLALITPPWLGFRLTSPHQDTMYAGMIVTYSVSPFLGLRMGWVTEITRCDEPYFFVDEQRLGPYRFWHHQHRFREVDGGVEVHDLIHYRLPFGLPGRLAGGPVRHKLHAIFDYRRLAMQERFGTVTTQGE